MYTRRRPCASSDGKEWTGDALVLAAGSQPNFFGTPGAAEHAFPLYSLDDATRLRSRILGLLRAGRRRPVACFARRAELRDRRRADRPASRSPARSRDMINVTMPAEYRHIDTSAAQIHLVDLGDALLKPFSDKAHKYVDKVLKEKGVDDPPRNRRQRGGQRPRRALRRHDRRRPGASSGAAESRRPLSRPTAVWLRATVGASTSPPDLTLAGGPGVYVVGRHRQHRGRGRRAAAAARLGRAPERQVGRRQHPRRLRGQGADAVPSTATRGSWR